MRFGTLEIDRNARTVSVAGALADLTSYQFDLLVAMAERAGRVLTRDQIMEAVRGRELEAFDRSIDVHIGRIRNAIEADSKDPKRILTVRGTDGAPTLRRFAGRCPPRGLFRLGAARRLNEMKAFFVSKLYLRIWLAVVAVVTVLTLAAGWLWQQALDEDRAERDARVTRTIVIRDADRDVIGEAPARALRIPGGGWEFEVLMKDGQKLFVLLPRPNRPEGVNNPGRRAPAWLQTPTGFAWLLGFVALAVALGAYPIVRRLTKRLEGLQKGVERWGNGDLSTRLPVQGQDEVAFLAERFNAAAERVQTLVKSHKSLLANASHELRSPLARIRMGLELLGRDGVSAQQRSEMARSIDELDQLIDEILLASRLDLRDASDASTLGPTEEVDLVGLAAEECARTGADLEIVP
eukprot:gene13944-29678_t